MNVQHICRRFVRESWGGTESAVLAMAKGLRARHYSTEVLTSAALAGSLYEEVDGVPVRRFEHFYPYFGLSQESRSQLDLRAGNLFSFSLLKHLVSSAPPDVYHLHTGKRMGGIVRTAARHHRRPYVISLHGGVIDVPADERERWTAPTQNTWEWGRILGAAVGARRVLQDAAAILCVNREEQKSLQLQYPNTRVHWTPNTVDTRKFAGGSRIRFRRKHQIPEHAQVILNVARVDEQKNQLATLDVFERLASRMPGVWLVFAGPTTNTCYAEQLDRRIKASSYANHILRLGNIDSASSEILDLYKAADVFLLSSTHEPFGIVLLESWAAGVPVVASRVGGIPSFVSHKTNGLLYNPGDIDEATHCVSQILGDPGTARHLRDHAAKAVTRFDTEQAMDSLLEIYEEVRHGRSLCA